MHGDDGDRQPVVSWCRLGFPRGNRRVVGELPLRRALAMLHYTL